MIDIVLQVIEYFTKYQKEPSINEIKFDDSSLLEKRGSVFVTIYSKGEVRGSAGNLRELKNSLVNELIENTIAAISKDNRFKPVGISEVPELKVRIDLVENRTILKGQELDEKKNVIKESELKSVDPTKNGVIAIKKDYSKSACILPNIDPRLLNGEDFGPMLKEKMKEKSFDENEYIVYKIETTVESNI